MTLTREQLKQATRLRVLDAASRLFRERGFTSTTVRDIAEAAQVSAGTVMAVGDKSALLVAVFDTMIGQEHSRRTGAAVPSPDVASCADCLTALVEPFVLLFTDSPELARAYASILVSGAHASTLFTDLAAQLIEEFGAVVTQRGCRPEADAPATAAALHAAYVGTVFTWSARGAEDRPDLMNSLHSTFAAICTCRR